MASIWDLPVPPEAPTDRRTMTGSQNPTAPDVAVSGTAERLTGTFAGPLLTAAGRGVKNGVPYGETEQTRLDTLNQMYPFPASGGARLAAATRQALGR